MNKIRRKALYEIIDRLEELINDIKALKVEEEEYRDKIVGNPQYTDCYEESDAARKNLDRVLDYLEDAIGYIDEAVEKKHYAIIEHTTGDDDEEIFDGIDQAIKTADYRWRIMSPSDKKKRTFFAVFSGKLDEDGCLDWEGSKMIKCYKDVR